MVFSGGMIEFLAFFQGVLDDHVRVRAVLTDIAFRHHNNVLGETKTPEMTVDRLRRLASMDAVRNDHQDIKITVRSHFSPCCRAEQDDPQRMDYLSDAPDEFVNHFWVGLHVYPFPTNSIFFRECIRRD